MSRLPPSFARAELCFSTATIKADSTGHRWEGCSAGRNVVRWVLPVVAGDFPAGVPKEEILLARRQRKRTIGVIGCNKRSRRPHHRRRGESEPPAPARISPGSPVYVDTHQ